VQEKAGYFYEQVDPSAKLGIDSEVRIKKPVANPILNFAPRDKIDHQGQTLTTRDKL
jgi:hypothetical protein